MKITIFTSNQPRHLSFVSKLSKISDECFAILECNTLFPGFQEDFFKKSIIMQNYFSKVLAAEKKIFNENYFLNSNIKVLSAKMGDLNKLSKQELSPALQSDIYIVFGSSYIKGWLIDYLLNKKAINIHMGISPFYRGSSCNFWAAYQDDFHLIGATIHLLSKGLDSGNILYHVLPNLDNCKNCFEFSMNAVKDAQDSIIENIKMNRLLSIDAVKQDKTKEIKYTKNIDFTDEEANNFLNNEPSIKYIKDKLRHQYDEDLYIKKHLFKDF